MKNVFIMVMIFACTAFIVIVLRWQARCKEPVEDNKPETVAIPPNDTVAAVEETFNEYSSVMHSFSDELHDCVASLKYCSEGFGQSVRTLQELVKRYPSLAYDIGEIDEIHAPDAGQ